MDQVELDSFLGDGVDEEITLLKRTLAALG